VAELLLGESLRLSLLLLQRCLQSLSLLCQSLPCEEEERQQQAQ
jgi:hypothetical protein